MVSGITGLFCLRSRETTHLRFSVIASELSFWTGVVYMYILLNGFHLI